MELTAYPPTPDFYTSTPILTGETVDNDYEPVDYILYGVTVRVGDGSDTSDLQYVAFDNNNYGSETRVIGETRIGSNRENLALIQNGKIRARLFDGGTQLTNREDNLYWAPRYDQA